MSDKLIRPGLAAAMTAVRGLYAAGWKSDAVTDWTDGSTRYDMIHPSGRELAATVAKDGDTTDLTMTGLSLEQVAGAVTGAGLAPAAPEQPGAAIVIDPAAGAELAEKVQAEVNATDPDPRVDLADVLRSLALDIVDYKLPLPLYYFTLRACLESRADVQSWADFYGVPVTMGGTAENIPCAEQEIEFGDHQSIRIVVQGPAEKTPEDPEKAALRAEVDKLRAQLAAGSAS